MDQTGQVGTALASPLVVQIADAFGNPIAGIDVVWTVDGGGSVSSATTTTGADGQTSVTRTLGTTAGTQRTLASVDGLAGSPVTFVHTATAGAASGLSIVSGDDQTGPVSTELPHPLVVAVRDGGGNPVPGVGGLVGHRRGRGQRNPDHVHRPTPPDRPARPGPWVARRESTTTLSAPWSRGSAWWSSARPPPRARPLGCRS